MRANDKSVVVIGGSRGLRLGMVVARESCDLRDCARAVGVETISAGYH
jgi:hypothetical protein